MYVNITDAGRSAPMTMKSGRPKRTKERISNESLPAISKNLLLEGETSLGNFM